LTVEGGQEGVMAVAPGTLMSTYDHQDHSKDAVVRNVIVRH